MDLKIIGAGLSRTGTLSLQVALQVLLKGKCYHTIDLFSMKNKKHLPLWIEAMKADSELKLCKEDWDKIFADYEAAVGLPSCFFFEELMKLNPEAKIILTLPQDEWFDSMRKTIIKAYETIISFPVNIYIGFSPLKSMEQFCTELDRKTSLIKNLRETDESGAKKLHEQWINHVVKTVPKKKLLIYDIKLGWKPLCKFLDLPIPSEPFVKYNERQNFQKLLLLVKLASCVFIFGIPLITAVITIVYYNRLYK